MMMIGARRLLTLSSEEKQGMIRKKPLKPGRSEVFGFNRLHVGHFSGLLSKVLDSEGRPRGVVLRDENGERPKRTREDL